MHRQPAYITLISLIIISAIVTGLALAIVFLSLTQKFALLDQYNSIKSYYLAQSCANYAIYQLQENPDYKGNEQVTLEAEKCYINNVESGSDKWQIEVSSDQNHYQSKIILTLSQLRPQIVIDGWQVKEN